MRNAFSVSVCLSLCFACDEPEEGKTRRPSPDTASEVVDTGGFDTGEVDTEVSLRADVAYPFLTSDQGELIFPTYLAHLVGSEVDTPYLSTDLVCVTLTNTGNVSVRASVSSSLSGYSDEHTELVELAPGGEQTACLNPTPDLASLYGLSANTSSRVPVTISDASSGEVLYQSNRSVTISTVNDVFWALNGAQAYETASVLVTPHAPGVEALLDEVVEYSWLGNIGIGGYRADSGAWWDWSYTTLQPGEVYTEPVFLESDELLRIATQASGSGVEIHILNHDQYELLFEKGILESLWFEPVSTSSTTDEPGSFDTDMYYVAIANLGGSEATAAYTRTISRADNVWDYLQMVYTYLQQSGINYVNVAGNFFDGGQYVLLPDEVVGNGGGNCIDGAILFASILELIDVRAAISIVPGHAFVSVASRSGEPGDDPGVYWSIETTMMGTMSGGAFQHDWISAINSAQDQWNHNAINGTLTVVSIDSMRAAGLTPIPH